MVLTVTQGGHQLANVMNTMELTRLTPSRFEEVDDEPTKGQKRARESDAAGDEKSTKAEKKAKKMKAEGGVAVPVESASAPKAEKKKKKDKKSGEEGQKKADGEKKKEEPAKKTLPSGVTIQDAKVGTGPMAKKGNTVRMRYIGKFTNGKEFDKNTSGKPVRAFLYILIPLVDVVVSSSSPSTLVKVRSSKAGMRVSLECKLEVNVC